MQLITSEIKDNQPLSKKDMFEMAFYVNQTFDRYQKSNYAGFFEAEQAFKEYSEDSQDDTVTEQFRMENEGHMRVANNSLGQNIMSMFEFIYKEQKTHALFCSEEPELPFEGGCYGGINDFLLGTISSLMLYQPMMLNGGMETYYGANKINLLVTHFFALIKLVYGSFDDERCPDMSTCENIIYQVIPHNEHFSFRELTLLSGYKTERAVRNLASPSTPEQRRLKTIKVGGKTFVTYKEAVRWLKQQQKL